MQAILASRDEIPALLNHLNLTGIGVEVGVCEGAFSEWILKHWNGSHLYSVDPWKHFGEDYSDINNVEQQVHDERYESVCQRLSVFGSRSKIVRKTSLDASVLFGNGKLDFVYLDAQHHYEAVCTDIEAWYPKVKHGGIISGHDFVDGHYVGGIFGVKKAVNEFAQKTGEAVFVAADTNTPSWIIFKGMGYSKDTNPLISQ